ncbi:hypothetical protein HII28_02195 [Planctomonas sp. JC2975]|uniref:hypothetical protein n=1 Tax=Planctomonas sp. JC2975 TaxID=2729626 RepID=UPI001474EA91|nr:hypothetical protein [Planctomonas sp. JC2975]NNC10698.1 hypothetical protein [Planctomonas sp. JC2975]
MLLLRSEWEHLEADFTRYYGADLRALCWGSSRWSARRILGHIRSLPHDSATVRAHLTPEAQWETTHELLAAVVDVLRAQTVSLVRTWGGEMDDPKPLPRPGEKPAEIPTISLAEWAATL